MSHHQVQNSKRRQQQRIDQRLRQADAKLDEARKLAGDAVQDRTAALEMTRALDDGMR